MYIKWIGFSHRPDISNQKGDTHKPIISRNFHYKDNGVRKNDIGE